MLDIFLQIFYALRTDVCAGAHKSYDLYYSVVNLQIQKS